MRTSSRPSSRSRSAALGAALAVAGGCVVASAAPAAAHEITGPISGETRAALGQLRAATAAYHDRDRALADGFVPASECVSNPDGPGAMGVHYLDPSRLADGFDLTRPEVLIYEPRRNGTMRLVGVEYVAMDADQDPSTVEHHEFTGGIGYHAPHGPGPVAYTLHAWVWKSNPLGMFVDYNPRNSCA